MKVLTSKSELSPDLINISKAVKNLDTGKWDCKITYDNEDLIFLTPRCKLLSDGRLHFNIQSKKNFMSFLEHLENRVVNYFYSNCKTIFNGKTFTLERLRDSLECSIDIIDDGSVTMNTIVSENVKCFDIYGNNTELSELGEYVSAHVYIDKISFTKELFKIRYVLVNIKTSKVKISASFSEERNPHDFFD
jgi:hypothetical protein